MRDNVHDGALDCGLASKSKSGAEAPLGAVQAAIREETDKTMPHLTDLLLTILL